MIYTRDHKTGSLFDQWKFLGPKRRKLLEASWAGLFRKEILHELPVDQIAPSFHSGFGRPTKELYTALGALVLQQMNDYSDHDRFIKWPLICSGIMPWIFPVNRMLRSI